MAMKKLSNKKTFTKKNLENVPNQSGIYVFSSQNGAVLNVGEAGGGRLRERLFEHLNQKDIPGAKNFQVRTTTGKREAQKLEKEYIKRLNPKLNIKNN